MGRMGQYRCKVTKLKPKPNNLLVSNHVNVRAAEAYILTVWSRGSLVFSFRFGYSFS